MGRNAICNEEFAKISDSKLSYVELSFSEYCDFDFETVNIMAKNHGIKLWSLHLPFAPFEKLDPSSLDKEKREYTFETFLNLIKKAAEIGIDKVIVHPSAEPIEDCERKLRLENSAKFLSRLADAASEFNVTVVVENLPRSCIGKNSCEILYLLSANEKLRVCFDTNHLLGESISDFIKNVGNKIVSLHISDYDFINERHWLPGEGDIDWQNLFDCLQEISYNGAWIYELHLKAPNTINRRDLNYSDIFNNATEIFGGKKPTQIGKRIENLGFWGPI